MGGSCTKEVQEALQGAVKNHLTDMSEQTMGNQERQSGGIRLLDLHGGGTASVFIGAVFGLLVGGALATWITRRAMLPWKELAVSHANAKGEPLISTSTAAASARLKELNAATQANIGMARITEIREDGDQHQRRRGSSDDVRRLARKIDKLEVASERLHRRAIPLPPPSPSPLLPYWPAHAAPSPAASMGQISPCQQTTAAATPGSHFAASPQP